jgi:hypothetical protein
MTHLLKRFRIYQREKRDNKLNKQQKEFEKKGYYTRKDGGRNFRSPFAKGDFETQQQFEKRYKTYSPTQRKLGKEGTFKPEV